MTASRVGSWSAIDYADPSGTLPIGAGADRAFVICITAEHSGAWSPTSLIIGGEEATEIYVATLDAGATEISVAFLVWDEQAIDDMVDFVVDSYAHSGAETGQNWQCATFLGIAQIEMRTFAKATALSADDLDVATAGFTDDILIVGAARDDPARGFATWDNLAEIEDQANGQGYRHAIAEGTGGDNETTAVGDGTPGSIVLASLVLKAGSTDVDSSFTCNGVLSLGDSHKDNLEKLLSAFDGRLSYAAGLWTVRASEWEASSFSITESHIVGPIKVRASAPRSDRFNTVRGTFIDPARNYEPAEFPHVSRSTYLDRDAGTTLEYDLLLPMTNTARMAQRLAYRALDQGNNQLVAEFPVNFEGAQIKIGDVVDVTISEFSWSGKTFRVIGWKPSAAMEFALVLREDNAASYTNPSAGDYADYTGEDPNDSDPSVPAPINFAAQAVPLGVKLNWRNPNKYLYDLIDIYSSGDDQWANAELAVSIRGTSWTDLIDEGEIRYYWLRARNNDGEVSDRVPDSDTSNVTGTAGNTGGCTFGALGSKALTNSASDPTDANCGYRLNSDGYVYTRSGLGAWVQGEQWKGSCISSSYEARMTLGSGNAYTTGTVDAWEALDTTRTWELLVSVPGGEANSGTIEMRRIADDIVGETRTITMDSEVE